MSNQNNNTSSSLTINTTGTNSGTANFQIPNYNATNTSYINTATHCCDCGNCATSTVLLSNHVTEYCWLHQFSRSGTTTTTSLSGYTFSYQPPNQLFNDVEDAKIIMSAVLRELERLHKRLDKMERRPKKRRVKRAKRRT